MYKRSTKHRGKLDSVLWRYSVFISRPIKFRNPIPTPFHWDLQIYQKQIRYNEQSESEKESESSSEEEYSSEVSFGRKDPRNIPTSFKVGKQRSIQVGNTYEAGNMVILTQE